MNLSDFIRPTMVWANLQAKDKVEVIDELSVHISDNHSTLKKEEIFDAVVSDIEMPRMNGFELTMKIRADKVMSEIPVILVTSLSKTEDREKGIEVGANAYIIKSNFDQSNLLEILERLV